MDVIIVLRCPTNKNGSASATMKKRVEEAVELYQGRQAQNIIFTGGAVWNQHIESEAMAEYAKKPGVPSEAFVLENKARFTIENAKYAIEIMRQKKWKTAFVVISPYHIRRAAMLFETSLDLELSFIPTDEEGRSFVHHVREILLYPLNRLLRPLLITS